MPPPAPIVRTSSIGTRSGRRKSSIGRRRLRGRPSSDDRDVEAGAAHVAGDDPVIAGLASDPGRRDDAGRRPGAEQVARALARAAGGDQRRRWTA